MYTSTSSSFPPPLSSPRLSESIVLRIAIGNQVGVLLAAEPHLGLASDPQLDKVAEYRCQDTARFTPLHNAAWWTSGCQEEGAGAGAHNATSEGPMRSGAEALKMSTARRTRKMRSLASFYISERCL